MRSRRFAWVVAVWAVVLSATLWCTRPSADSEMSLDVPRRQVIAYMNPALAATPIVGQVPADDRFGVEVSLPVRDPAMLKAHVRSVSDPRDPSFRHFISQEKFGRQHGARTEDYRALTDWAHAHEFDVTTHPNHLVVSLGGSAADFEKAFRIKLVYATRPDGTRFRRPDREPSIALVSPVLHVAGLDDFEVHEPAAAIPVRSIGFGQVSGQAHPLAPQDLRHLYVGDSGLTGAGQTICLYEDPNQCMSPLDVKAYANQDGGVNLHWSTSQLLSSSGTDGGAFCPLTDSGLGVRDGSLLPNGGSLNEAGQLQMNTYPLPNYETTLDVTMAAAIAPGANILLYANIKGTNPVSALQTFADNGCKQVSSSFNFDIDATAENLLDEMALQGQSVFFASADYGAWTASNNPSGQAQAVTVVGGNIVVMDGAAAAAHLDATPGQYSWPGSGGGLTVAPIPAYQLSAALAAATMDSGVSTTNRNGPDISAAGSNIDIEQTAWVLEAGPGHHLARNPAPGSGTSFAAPIWAGFMALVNQQIQNNYDPHGADLGAGVGFANPSLYAIAASPDAAGALRDIVQGKPNPTLRCSDGSAECIYNVAGYPVGPGFDLVTGLGAPTPALIDILANLQDNPWYAQNLQSLIVGGHVENSAVPPITNVAGNLDGGSSPGAWAVGDGGLYRYAASSFTRLSPTADGGSTGTVLQVAVSPTGVPWFLNASGVAYAKLPSQSGRWTTMNQVAPRGQAHNDLRWLAVGKTDVWAVTNTHGGDSGTNYTITVTTPGTDGSSTWSAVTNIFGVQVAVSPSTDTPWVLDAQGLPEVAAAGAARRGDG